MTSCEFSKRDYRYVREKLLNREEIAFLDVREEAPHAEGHPLFAANFPLTRLEVDAYTRFPRRDVPIVVIDNGEGLAEKAAERLLALGYLDVAVFEGGVAAWEAAGGELFIDVNVPSKAFGEMMEAACHTPSLPAEEIKAMLDDGTDMVIVDVRRFDEYQTMCIPSAVSVPGAELVLRVPDLVDSPQTQVIVNCAGRTRGLVGTQSLINAGLPNPVAALRNGTIGWSLARQELDLGQSRTFSETPQASAQQAAGRARAVADQAGVKRATHQDLANWFQETDRTTYYFDVRSRDEYEKAHVPDFYSIHGGQLVQETETYAPVRGARIVLMDDDGARANMTASWLAQMAWDVYVLDGLEAGDFSESGPWPATLPPVPEHDVVSAVQLQQWLEMDDTTVVVDVSRHALFKKAHIPGAWYVLRSQLAESFARVPGAQRYVVSCSDGAVSPFVAAEIDALVTGSVFVLSGGNQAWTEAGYALEAGEANLAVEPIDRYRRPYEGTDISPQAMQAYLDWEFGLIEQMRKDGTHHFIPMTAS